MDIFELSNHPNSRDFVKSVVKLAFGKLSEKTQKWVTYFEPLEKQARITLLSAVNYLVIEELVNVLESAAENPFIRYEIANLLSKMCLADRFAHKRHVAYVAGGVGAKGIDGTALWRLLLAHQRR